MPLSFRSSRKSSKKRRRITPTHVNVRSGSMRPSSDIRDELTMSSASSMRTVVGQVKERNGNTYQKAVSTAPSKHYRVSHRDLTNMIAPVYKYRYDGFGWNQAITDCSFIPANPVTPQYYPTTGKTLYDTVYIGNPAGVWKSCEWAAGNQYWFESTALPFYKKIPDGSRRSLTELISKYSDVVTNTAFASTLDIATYYKQLDSALSETGSTAPNPILNSVNICYHGGSQKHVFTNFGITTVTLELWELHPRRFMSGYTMSGQTAAGLHIFNHERPSEDLIKDLYDNACAANNKEPFDDKKNIDEIQDIGVRIDNDCRRILFKYKVSKPMKVSIAPGGTFTYEMKIPAFKVTGGEFLDYLTRHTTNDVLNTTAGEQLRITERPAWIPKFTRVLCGRMYGQKGFGLGTTGKPDGNTADTSFISKLGYGAGRVGHTMSEYHAMNLMPYAKPVTYSHVNYLDTTGITEYIDGGDDEQITFADQTGNDAMDTSNALTQSTAN